MKNEKQKVQAVENNFLALKCKISELMRHERDGMDGRARQLHHLCCSEVQQALDACMWSINELTEEGQRRNQEKTVVTQILKNNPPGPLVSLSGQLVVRGAERRTANPAGRKNYNQRRVADRGSAKSRHDLRSLRSPCSTCPRDDCDKSCPCYDEGCPCYDEGCPYYDERRK